MQKQLIERIRHVLKSDDRILAAYLAGSYGRGDADGYSDVDIAILVEKDNLDALFENIGSNIENISDVLFSKTIDGTKTINVITPEWLRFDLSLYTKEEFISFFTRGEIKPLFDNMSLLEELSDKPKYEAEFTNDELIDFVSEFIRVLGLLPVVIGREEFVIGQKGTELLKNMLTALLIKENDPQIKRGALSLKKILTKEQMQVLEDVPSISPNQESIIAAHLYIAKQFFPRAKKMANKMKIIWPQEFEERTVSYLAKNGIMIR